MTAPSSSPPASGLLSSRFSLRSSGKTRKRRFWFKSSPKPSSPDLAEDAAAAAREVDAEIIQTKPRAGSYVPRVEYGSPRCGVEERDASWTSDEQVEAHYAALGWAVVQICKDGNCLFRAISDQLYTNELFHQDIRRRLVDFIESDEKLFKPFIEDEEVADYCARLRKDGQWGGHLELYAAAKLFNIHIVVHTGPVRRLRVTNDDEGETAGQNPPPPPPYRILHLLFKDDHYSSLHSNEPVTTVTAEETTADSIDKRARSPTKAYDSPDKKCVKYQDAPASKVVKIEDLAKKSAKFEEVMEAKPAPREGKTCAYEEEDVPECGVFLPKQVLFRKGKRRVSGATLFSLVHVPSARNLSPVEEASSEASSSFKSTTASETSSSSEEQENDSETKPPVPPSAEGNGANSKGSAGGIPQQGGLPQGSGHGCCLLENEASR